MGILLMLKIIAGFEGLNSIVLRLFYDELHCSFSLVSEVKNPKHVSSRYGVFTTHGWLR